MRATVYGAWNAPVSLKRVLLPLDWYPQSWRRAWLLHAPPQTPTERLRLTPGLLFWFSIPSPGDWHQPSCLTLTSSLVVSQWPLCWPPRSGFRSAGRGPPASRSVTCRQLCRMASIEDGCLAEAPSLSRLYDECRDVKAWPFLCSLGQL